MQKKMENFKQTGANALRLAYSLVQECGPKKLDKIFNKPSMLDKKIYFALDISSLYIYIYIGKSFVTY